MRWRAAAAPTKKIAGSAARWRCAAGADHRDLQPHRRHLRLAGLHGEDLGDRKHRGREQPLRHGPSSRRGLRGGRSPRAEGRPVGAVRPQRLAQPGLSRSEPVSALILHLAPLAERPASLEIRIGRSRVRGSSAVTSDAEEALSPQPLTSRPRKNGARARSKRRCRPLSCPHKTRDALRMAQPLARIIDQLKREPRAPAPSSSPCSAMPSCRAAARCGSARCWIFRGLDIDRRGATAMSRLAADGWLEREKVGRNSFYRLAEKAGNLRDRDPPHLRSAAVGLDRALRAAADRQWRGSRRLARGAEKCRLRQPLPGVWVAPSGAPIPEAAGAIRLEVSAEDDSGRRLLSESWPLHAPRMPI